MAIQSPEQEINIKDLVLEEPPKSPGVMFDPYVEISQPYGGVDKIKQEISLTKNKEDKNNLDKLKQLTGFKILFPHEQQIPLTTEDQKNMETQFLSDLSMEPQYHPTIYANFFDNAIILATLFSSGEHKIDIDEEVYQQIAGMIKDLQELQIKRPRLPQDPPFEESHKMYLAAGLKILFPNQPLPEKLYTEIKQELGAYYEMSKNRYLGKRTTSEDEDVYLTSYTAMKILFPDQFTPEDIQAINERFRSNQAKVRDSRDQFVWRFYIFRSATLLRLLSDDAIKFTDHGIEFINDPISQPAEEIPQTRKF